ncbi:MAG: hypothetical protein OEQ39_16815 [Gammaproteobacteria bacterium]|nr:hypothetical protein [Gammaproteobacteria bacterium]MDH3466005.1 hypothetical protein [Gammaproteobacteria bacterium]
MDTKHSRKPAAVVTTKWINSAGNKTKQTEMQDLGATDRFVAWDGIWFSDSREGMLTRIFESESAFRDAIGTWRLYIYSGKRKLAELPFAVLC